MRSGSEALFQVAVALIPALLFGGAMRRPEQAWPSQLLTRVLLSIGVVIVVAVSVAAEIFALQGVIDPAVPRWKTGVVVVTIVGGTVLIAALTVWSWLRSAPQGAQATQPAVSPPRRPLPSKARAVGSVALGVCAFVAAYLAASGMTESLDRVDARAQWARADERVRATSASLARADHAVTTARASLITTILRMRPRTRRSFSAPVERRIHAIDDVVQPMLRRERPSDARIERAEAALFTWSNRLSDPFYKDLGTPRADPEVHLAALAVDRLTKAEAVRLAAKKSSARARRSHVGACRRVTATGAGEEPPPGCPTVRS